MDTADYDLVMEIRNEVRMIRKILEERLGDKNVKDTR